MQKASRVRRVIVVLFAAFFVLVLAVVTLQIYHHSQYGHYVPFGLHADVIASGGTQLFDAHLTNFGFLPEKVERCEVVSDAGAREENVPYRLERLNRETNTWEILFEAERNSCRPYPMVSRTVWPGQTLSIGPQATEARGDVTGKTMRFVIEANGRQFPTGPFEVIWVAK
jgi:hypothetical protein